ncbi:S8 family peptidase [Anoxybacterium hadale]|uniref:S8 family peptidase n=1 Tax=Anoxybacterium hadale TaxID=3408580 RepID=A0ACD1AHI6_9FIRM|nr:S8 family peptidase [Clostridiales bacterium]
MNVNTLENTTVPNNEFMYHPDTMDFLVRRTEYITDFLETNPNIVQTQTLMGRYIIAYTDRRNNDMLMDFLGSSYANSTSLICGLLDRESLEAAGIYQVQQQPFLNLRGRGVLVGFVDTGIDYTKETFINEFGFSKVQYLYDQTIPGTPPEGFLMGTEYNNIQLNAALRSEDPYSIVPSRDTVGHGTFLASIAAGRQTQDGFVGAAPEAELIVVKLRKARPFYLERFLVPPEQENAYEYSDIMIGIEYIMAKAQQLGRPVSICIALGTNLGSHDGFSIFEEYISDVSSLRGVCVCTAAGNESQARHHTQGVLTSQNEEQNIDIRVGENAGDFMISLWNNASDRMSVSVRSPTGEVVGRVPAKAGTQFSARLVMERARVMIEYYFPLEGSGSQLTVISIFNATPGIWTIVVHGDIVLDGTYNAWLPLTGFVSPTVGFLSPSPYMTVVVPSTAIGVICCGAYNPRTESLYLNTSWGPTRAMTLKPDFVAPGVEVGGVFPSGPGRMTGTSVSCALAAGASALLLQWGIVRGNEVSMSTYHIRAYLIRGCSRSETITYPNQQWGYGSLNLMQTFSLMREL